MLASDLVFKGRFLLPEGATLQPKHIKAFLGWGIEDVDIVDSEETQSAKKKNEPAIDRAALEKAQAYLRPLFPKANLKHEAMKELFRLAVWRVAGELARGEALPEVLPQGGGDEPGQMNSQVRIQPSGSASELVNGKVELTSLPDIYTRIVEVLKSPNCSAAQLAKMVSTDASLSSSLLKMVNSAFYSFSKRIDSISRAITMIGNKELVTMALGVSVVNTFGDIPKGLISMEGFWRHSIACGVFARLLASHSQDLSGEQLFVGGLLHDVGRLIMIKEVPTYEEALAFARKKRVPIHVAEKDVLGFDHTRVGGLLCQKWKFSKSMEEMVWFHHAPSRGKYAKECCIVHMANIMAEVFLASQSDCGSVTISPIEDKAWEALGLPTSVLAPTFAKADKQINEIVKLFLNK